MNLKQIRQRSITPAASKKRLLQIISWLEVKRSQTAAEVKLVPFTKLSDWLIDNQQGLIRHIRGSNHFFSVQGVVVKNSPTTEVSSWNQPILVQKEGGHLVIFCQEQSGVMKFLLQAKFEPGNIHKLQLSPTLQATQSNLKQHHQGKKPKLSEYLNHPKVEVIYSTKHNEEGGRFYQKSNINSLILLPKTLNLPIDDHFIWLTLAEIKQLMLVDHIINPFVKTILAPL